MIAHVLPGFQGRLKVQVFLYRHAAAFAEDLLQTVHALAGEGVADDVHAAVLRQRVPDHQVRAAYVRVEPGRHVHEHVPGN